MSTNFEWYRRAHASIAHGGLTNSKRVETFIKGVTPTHAIKAQGEFLYTIDGRKMLDYCCANGTNLFGYNNPTIRRAIADQLEKGWLYSLGSTMEVECAELVKGKIPFIKKLRFLNSGSEACNAAIKIARAHTGREIVLSSGYHGWGDDFCSLSPPAIGVPRSRSIRSLTDFKEINNSVACVIVEPVITKDDARRREWLSELIRRCRANGTLVIFDEVITGLRFPGLSFSKFSGIYPDIICMGKALGAGLPLSLVGFTDPKIDEKEWFVSSTTAGELLSMAAMKAVFKLLGDSKYQLSDLFHEGQKFIDKFNALWPDGIQLEGYPTRGVFIADPHIKALFFQETHKAGILFGPSWFFNFKHPKHTDQTISVCQDILTRIRNKQVKLEGEPPASPFAQTVRENK